MKILVVFLCLGFALPVFADPDDCPYGDGVRGKRIKDKLPKGFYVNVWDCADPKDDIPSTGRHYRDQAGRNPMRKGGMKPDLAATHEPKLISFETAEPLTCRVMDGDWRAHSGLVIPTGTTLWGFENGCYWIPYPTRDNALGSQRVCSPNVDDYCANPLDCDVEVVRTTLIRGLDGVKGADGAPGAQGPQGGIGPEGPRGTKGDPCTILGIGCGKVIGGALLVVGGLGLLACNGFECLKGEDDSGECRSCLDPTFSSITLSFNFN